MSTSWENNHPHAGNTQDYPLQISKEKKYELLTARRLHIWSLMAEAHPGSGSCPPRDAGQVFLAPNCRSGQLIDVVPLDSGAGAHRRPDPIEGQGR
jgi:hypothetical protein